MEVQRKLEKIEANVKLPKVKDLAEVGKREMNLGGYRYQTLIKSDEEVLKVFGEFSERY